MSLCTSIDKATCDLFATWSCTRALCECDCVCRHFRNRSPEIAMNDSIKSSTRTQNRSSEIDERTEFATHRSSNIKFSSFTEYTVFIIVETTMEDGASRIDGGRRRARKDGRKMDTIALGILSAQMSVRYAVMI